MAMLIYCSPVPGGVGLGDKDCKAQRCFDENRKASLSLLAWHQSWHWTLETP